MGTSLRRRRVPPELADAAARRVLGLARRDAGWVPALGDGAVRDFDAETPVVGLTWGERGSVSGVDVEIEGAEIELEDAEIGFEDVGHPSAADPGRRPTRGPRHAVVSPGRHPSARGLVGGIAERLADRVPTTVRDGRLAIRGIAAAGLALVAVAALAFAVSLLWRGRTQPVTTAPPLVVVSGSPIVSGGPPETGASGGSAGGALPLGGPLVVDVAGRVRRPGLATLAPGARVADALAAAGGVVRGGDTRALNLARRLVDGEQVLVLGAGEQPPAGLPPPANGGAGAQPSGGGPAGAVLDLNAATLEQLDALPGVGPVLAQRMLDWRSQHGRFSSVDELREVNGIGEAKFADLAARVRV
jgi:competence protein ComEA